MKVETLIIGQGIAGSVLSNKLMKRGEDFAVIDLPGLSTSSQIAAGIWNPVVFKRMTSSWLAKEAIPVMYNFFNSCEQLQNKKFLFPKKILKFFTEKQEADLWQKKSLQELSGFIDQRIYEGDKLNFNGLKHPEYGFSFVTESGFLDCKSFLEATKKQLVNKDKYFQMKFDASKILKEKGWFRVGDFLCEKIIFCEGWLSVENPFFSHVKFKPAKGEILIFESDELQEDFIVSKGVFILPIGNRKFVCGATYEWTRLDNFITKEGQSFLEEKLASLINCSFKVVERKAGVRPSVIDRRPVIGEHPTEKGLYIFNGFGTKAVMLAPHFAEIFLEFIYNNTYLSAEVDIIRFNKHL
ncbi:MAG: NAD(P)/FAD-dependent oxidoreductase [Bacteroidota bacterium]